jgi:hypothetical protein
MEGNEEVLTVLRCACGFAPVGKESGCQRRRVFGIWLSAFSGGGWFVDAYSLLLVQ